MDHLRFAKWLAHCLDEQFQLGPFHFGLDPIIDAIPLGGDAIGLLLSCYIIWVGRHLQAPDWLQHKMWRNILLDFMIGFVPFLGVIGDAWFKSNIRNIELLEKWLQQQPLEGRII